MKLKFIDRTAGARTVHPSLTLRQAGICSFNKPASETFSIEAGEAATLAFDEESKKWVLVYWPDGNADQCQLRASKHGITFSHAAACQQLFKGLPVQFGKATSIRIAIDFEQAVSDEQAPGAKCLVLEVDKMVRNDKSGSGKGATRG